MARTRPLRRDPGVRLQRRLLPTVTVSFPCSLPQKENESLKEELQELQKENKLLKEKYALESRKKEHYECEIKRLNQVRAGGGGPGRAWRGQEPLLTQGARAPGPALCEPLPRHGSEGSAVHVPARNRQETEVRDSRRE